MPRSFSIHRDTLKTAADLASRLGGEALLVFSPSDDADAPLALTAFDDRMRVKVSRAKIRGEVPAAFALHAFQVAILLDAVRSDWIEFHLDGGTARVANGEDKFEMRLSAPPKRDQTVTSIAGAIARVSASGFRDALRSGSIAAQRTGSGAVNLGGVRVAVDRHQLICFSTNGAVGSKGRAEASGAAFNVTVPMSSIELLVAMAAVAGPDGEVRLGSDGPGLFITAGKTSARVAVLERALPTHRPFMVTRDAYQCLATVPVDGLRAALGKLQSVRAHAVTIEAGPRRWRISGLTPYGTAKISLPARHRGTAGVIRVRATHSDRWLRLCEAGSDVPAPSKVAGMHVCLPRNATP